MSESHDSRPVSLGRYKNAALCAGGIGTLVMFAAMATKNHDAWNGYLFGYIVWASLSLGCLGVMLLQHTVNAKWGLPIIRLLEAGAGKTNFSLLGILFVPILYTVLTGHATLYKWADPTIVASDHILELKKPYLNAPFFAIRALGFFLIWFFWSGLMRRSTLRQDKSMDTKERDKRANWAAPGLVVFVLTITFSFTDWIMSLEPHWSSTMYGAWATVGMALMAIAVVTMIATLNADREPYKGLVTRDWTKDMGNLLLTFTMLWGYTTFSQYLIIWSGNLPEFITYYVNRSKGGWNAIGFVTLIGQFFIPFFCCLSPRVKAQPALLSKLCGWIIVMRLVDMYYTIIPAMRGTPLPTAWDFIALAGIGGLWVYAFSASIEKAPLMPDYDPRLREVAHAH